MRRNVNGETAVPLKYTYTYVSNDIVESGVQNGERTIGNKIFFSSLPFASRKRKERKKEYFATMRNRASELSPLTHHPLRNTLPLSVYPFVLCRANDNLRDEYRVGGNPGAHLRSAHGIVRRCTLKLQRTNHWHIYRHFRRGCWPTPRKILLVHRRVKVDRLLTTATATVPKAFVRR